MGTTSILLVKTSGKIKIAQPRWYDGYPSQEGVDILTFLLKEMKKDKFIAKLNNLRFTRNEQEEVDINKKQNSFEGSKILKYIQNNNENIVINSLNDGVVPECIEYGYLIDFDNNTYEIYSEALSSKKYAESKKAKEFERFNILAIYNLNELPSIEQFIDRFDIC